MYDVHNVSTNYVKSLFNHEFDFNKKIDNSLV